MPVNTSAIITFTSFKIVRAGRSFSRLVEFLSSATEKLTYAFNTTQITKYDLDLGIITNTGEHFLCMYIIKTIDIIDILLFLWFVSFHFVLFCFYACVCLWLMWMVVMLFWVFKKKTDLFVVVVLFFF